MTKSPGHQQMPDHSIREEIPQHRIRVRLDGEVLVESNDVIRVIEDGSPPRYYFKRADIGGDRLEPSTTTTRCPFKGTATYFDLKVNGATYKDAVWSYAEPYEEHARLAGRVAFYEEKLEGIEISPRM